MCACCLNLQKRGKHFVGGILILKVVITMVTKPCKDQVFVFRKGRNSAVSLCAAYFWQFDVNRICNGMHIWVQQDVHRRCLEL